MRKLLLIDDDETLAMLLKALLEPQGYLVLWGDRPSRGLALLKAERPDLLLLDVMLPERSGMEVVRELRAVGDQIPVIMLTARGDAQDRIGGLKLGADDYLPKPFDHLELQARIEAVLRRVSNQDVTTEQWLDRDRRTLHLSGREIGLTAMEYRLLDTLTSTPGRVYSRAELMNVLDDAGALESFDRAIDSHMSRLRNKIELDPRHPKHLLTARGMGYRFQW